jgi:hypothetical protein
MYSLDNLMRLLWFGKLPKVSAYHQLKYGSLYSDKDIFENKTAQVFDDSQVPTKVKQEIIQAYINRLYTNEVFTENVSGINIPLFNGKKVHGSGSVYQILLGVKEEIK